MLDSVLASNPAVTVCRFDVMALFGQALANPQLFNLTNVTSSAAPGLSPGDTSYDTSKIVSNPNQYLFWDDLHPTAAVHLILAHRALDLFFSPGDYNRNATSDAADYVMWKKGLDTKYVPIDYDIWRAHFGQLTAGDAALDSAGVSLNASVPEPATLLQIILLSTVLFSLRSRAVLKVPTTH
jgi:hypothetical protein